MLAVFAVLLAILIMLAGYYPGADRGIATATVRASETGRTWKSIGPHARIHAILENGAEIYTTSPHTPPPVPGTKIGLAVRQNIFGWYSYTWQVGKEPALTDGPGKL